MNSTKKQIAEVLGRGATTHDVTVVAVTTITSERAYWRAWAAFYFKGRATLEDLNAAGVGAFHQPVEGDIGAL